MNELMKSMIRDLMASQQVNKSTSQQVNKSTSQGIPNTVEEFKRAVKELGYSDEEIEKAIEGFDGFPLDLDELDNVAGGASKTTSVFFEKSHFR